MTRAAGEVRKTGVSRVLGCGSGWGCGSFRFGAAEADSSATPVRVARGSAGFGGQADTPEGSGMERGTRS